MNQGNHIPRNIISLLIVIDVKMTESLFLDLHLSISNGFVSSKIYDKGDDFEFDTANFPFFDCDVPCSEMCEQVRLKQVFHVRADISATILAI